LTALTGCGYFQKSHLTDTRLGRSSGVCTCLYYNIVHGAIRMPTYFRQPTQFHSTKLSRSWIYLWVPFVWSRQLRPPVGSFGSSARTHSHTAVAPTHRHALSHAHSSSRPPAIAQNTPTHTHTLNTTHTHTHTPAGRVCARRETRTKTRRRRWRARALSDSRR